MKNNPAANALLLTLALTLFGCSSSNDDSNNNNPNGDPSSSSGGDGGIESVTIGTQVWMKKNLDVDVAGSKCYDDLPANCTAYGRLYTWEMAKTACPNGWKLPDTTDYNKLIAYVESQKSCSKCAGNILKAANSWNDSEGKEGNGTDDFEFAGLPSGLGYLDGSFKRVGTYIYLWSATEYDATNAYNVNIASHREYADFDADPKTDLMAVRCIKD